MWLSSSSADQRSHSESKAARTSSDSFKGVTTHELSSCGWRAGARVEERDTDLAARKCCVQHREVAHDDGEKAEAGAGFKYGENACNLRTGSYVAEAERKEIGAADIKVGQVSDASATCH